MTRIIAGEFGGRRIAVPRGAATRPTADRVREAWMSILTPYLENAIVLDPNYSRAYVHHLVRSGEILGAMLMTEHNLTFYQRLMQGLRDAIREGRLAAYAAGFLDRYYQGKKAA